MKVEYSGMIIDRITSIKNKPNWFTVHFVDGTTINANTAHIADFNLYSSRELSEGEYTRLCEELEQSTLKAKALRILGNRNYSAYEIEKRLISKGGSRETAVKTVQWLKDTGMINDEQYAVTIVEHYREKGYGPARIKDELFRRGIPREIWDDALGDSDNINNYSATYDFLGKKLMDSRDKSQLRNATEALCRRGFSYEDARAAVNQYIDSVDGIDH
jgi:regulatory protein